MYKPYFSNKHAHGDSKIILIENEKFTNNSNEVIKKETLLVSNDEIAKTFNKHFAETVETLNTFEWPSNNTDLLNDQLTAIIKKFQNYPSIMKLKSKYNFQEKFSFKPVPVEYVETIIKNIPNNRAAGGEIPLHILKQSGFTYQMLTDCINGALSEGIFPDSLKSADITPVHKKDETTDKENYRPVSVLPLFSIVYYAVFGKLIPHNMLCSNYYKPGKKNWINLVSWKQYKWIYLKPMTLYLMIFLLQNLKPMVLIKMD